MNDEQTKTLNGHGIEAELLTDWRVMFDTLQARFRTGDFATGLRLVDEIGAAAEEMNHHPDLDLRYPTVHVRLSSHDVVRHRLVSSIVDAYDRYDAGASPVATRRQRAAGHPREHSGP